VLFTARLVQGFRLLADVGGRARPGSPLATPRERRGRALGTAIGAAVFGALLGPVIGAAKPDRRARRVSTVAGVCALLAVVVFSFEASRGEPQPLVQSSARCAGSIRARAVADQPPAPVRHARRAVPLALDRHGFSAAAIGAVWIGATAVRARSPVAWPGYGPARRAVPIRFAPAGSVLVALGLAAI